MIEGQCLCGAVYYRYHAEIEKTVLEEAFEIPNLGFASIAVVRKAVLWDGIVQWHANILKWCVA